MFKQINIISNKFISTSTLNAIINFTHKIQHKSLRHVKLNIRTSIRYDLFTLSWFKHK